MKALKIILLVVVVAIAAIVAGGVALIASVDPEDITARLANEVRQRTGRELTMSGPLEFGLWPKLRIKAGPLSLSNADGFGDAPMLTAENVQIAVSTWPLLSKRLEMETIVLHGVHLDLARDAAGHSNWDDFASRAGGDAHGGDQSGDHSGLAALILGGVDVKDAQLTWNDAVSGQKIEISKIVATTGPLTFGDPVEFKLSLSARANQPAFDGDINMNATVTYDLDDEHYIITPLAMTVAMRGAHLPGASAAIEFGAAVDINGADATATISALKLSGLGANLAGELKARDIDDNRPSATGTLAVAGTDLAQIFSAFKLPIGKQIAAVNDRAFKFDAAFDANMDSGEVVVSQFEGRLLGATMSGGFNATQANTDKPIAKGKLSANGPDLPLLVAVIGTLNGASAGALKSLNTAFGGAADKSFNVVADLDADLGAGNAALPKLEARLLGNTVTGELFATNVNADQPALKGRLKAVGPDLPSMLAVASSFQTDGKALRDMAKALAGEADKQFNIEADFTTDMASGRLDVPTLSADLLGLTIRGGMKGENVDFAKGAGTLDGQLKVDGRDIGPLLRGLGQGAMAKSVKTLVVDAGIKGNLSDLSIQPLLVKATVLRADGGKPVDLTLTAANARANLEADTLTLTGLSVTGLGLNAQAELAAEKIQTAPVFSGKLDVPAFNLRTLMASLNLPPPKSSDPTTLTSLGLTTSFTGTASSLKLDGLKAVVDQSHIQGGIDVANFIGPDIAFGIEIDTLNADRYLEATPPGETRAATPEVAAAGAASELPVSMLRELKLRGDLVIGDLVLSGAKIKNIKFSINAAGGKIKLDPLAAELYQGGYGGTITLDATGPQPVLGINTRLVNVNVEALLKDTVQNDSLSGIVSFDAALSATGGSDIYLKRSLAGMAKFGTTSGIFRGVDAVAVLRTVEQIIECKCPLPMPKGGETRFNSLGGTLNAQNGVIRNEDLLLAGDGFNITGKGMLANLHDNTLKYDLKLAVSEARTTTGTTSYNLGGYTIPIQCRGAIEEPSCLPDVGDLLTQVVTSAAKKKVEEAIGDKLKDAVGGEAGDALKQLFKF